MKKDKNVPVAHIETSEDGNRLRIVLYDNTRSEWFDEQINAISFLVEAYEKKKLVISEVFSLQELILNSMLDDKGINKFFDELDGAEQRRLEEALMEKIKSDHFVPYYGKHTLQ